MPEIEEAEKIISKFGSDQSNVIQMLSELQEEIEYLPVEVLKLVSEKLKIPMAKIYGVITFYSFFSLEPPAKNKIRVCHGTACHVRGAEQNGNHIKRRLGIKYGEQTEDGEFSIESVACIGACGLAPTVVINEKTYGRQTMKTLDKLLNKIGAPK
ncbi:MAG: NADH-quinone oxidoreductase subunit NuoE family protein [Candidatus Kariarchaeaceae archaeon]